MTGCRLEETDHFDTSRTNSTGNSFRDSLSLCVNSTHGRHRQVQWAHSVLTSFTSIETLPSQFYAKRNTRPSSLRLFWPPRTQLAKGCTWRYSLESPRHSSELWGWMRRYWVWFWEVTRRGHSGCSGRCCLYNARCRIDTRHCLRFFS